MSSTAKIPEAKTPRSKIEGWITLPSPPAPAPAPAAAAMFMDLLESDDCFDGCRWTDDECFDEWMDANSASSPHPWLSSSSSSSLCCWPYDFLWLPWCTLSDCISSPSKTTSRLFFPFLDVILRKLSCICHSSASGSMILYNTFKSSTLFNTRCKLSWIMVVKLVHTRLWTILLWRAINELDSLMVVSWTNFRCKMSMFANALFNDPFMSSLTFAMICILANKSFVFPSIVARIVCRSSRTFRSNTKFIKLTRMIRSIS